MSGDKKTQSVRIDKDVVERLRKYRKKTGKIQKYVASKAIAKYLDEKEEKSDHD